MDAQEVRELFFEQLEQLSPEAEYELRHPDYVMEMPQSGERIRGRDKMRAFQEAYPNPPTITPRRVAGSGDVWVIEGRSDYGNGQIFHLAMIVEFATARSGGTPATMPNRSRRRPGGRNGWNGWRNRPSRSSATARSRSRPPTASRSRWARPSGGPPWPG